MSSAARGAPRSALAWVPLVLYAGLVYYLSSQSQSQLVMPFAVGDKPLHAIEFAIFFLTALVALTWGSAVHRRGSRYGLALAVALAYAAADEWHQAFVPGRDASIADFIADGAGALCGFLLALLIESRHAPAAESP